MIGIEHRAEGSKDREVGNQTTEDRGQTTEITFDKITIRNPQLPKCLVIGAVHEPRKS